MKPSFIFYMGGWGTFCFLIGFVFGGSHGAAEVAARFCDACKDHCL